MKVISRDVFFILGVKSLVESFNISDASGMVVFDSGGGNVYIFNGEGLRREEINDPIKAMVHCGQSCFSRSALLEEYIKRLCRRGLSEDTIVQLSWREEMVINALCKMAAPKSLAKKLNITDATVSGYKQKALRKLGLKNIVMLHTVLQSWREMLQVIYQKSHLSNSRKL